MAATAIALLAITSCDEDTDTIGQTLTAENDKLELNATTYGVATRTIVADSVFSLSDNCYFGRVRDPETGTEVTSEFTTQFHLLETTYMSPERNILSRWNGRAAADSCELVLYLSSPFRAADSLTAMKMTVRELSTPMTEGTRYYSNFDPQSEGMTRSDGINKSKMFTYNDLGELDSIRTLSTYQYNIRIGMNEPYTAPDGTTYNNYGTYIMRCYYDTPENFRNSYTFTHSVCPGFYFQIADGLGFHAKVSDIGLRTYYKVQTDTAVYAAALTLAGTSEVLQTIHVQNDQAALKAMAAQTGHTYLKTPAGLFTEVTLPVLQIKQGHETDSILAAKLTLQRMNNQSTDSRTMATPQRLLMVQKDSLQAFFENSRVPDNRTTYYTAFNNPVPSSTTYYSNNNTYTFNNLSNLVTALYEQYKKGTASDPNWVQNHPDWNNVVLVPITYTTSSTSTTITNVQHDMSLTSVRLVQGTGKNDSPIQISIVYGNFK